MKTKIFLTLLATAATIFLVSVIALMSLDLDYDLEPLWAKVYAYVGIIMFTGIVSGYMLYSVVRTILERKEMESIFSFVIPITYPIAVSALISLLLESAESLKYIDGMYGVLNDLTYFVDYMFEPQRFFTLLVIIYFAVALLYIFRKQKPA